VSRIGQNPSRAPGRVFAGAMASPAALPAGWSAHRNPHAAVASHLAERGMPDRGLFVQQICAVKTAYAGAVRVEASVCQKSLTPCWNQPSAIRSTSSHPAVHDQRERHERGHFSAHRTHRAIYAKDGGLMGIPCIVDKQGVWNGPRARHALERVMDPATQHRTRARRLATIAWWWRDQVGAYGG